MTIGNRLKIFIFMVQAFALSAYAQFDVHLKNYNNSIDGNQLEDASLNYQQMKIEGQEEGDVLYFDANANDGKGAWRTFSISGLKFLGSWDVQKNLPSISIDGVYENEFGEKIEAMSGDYFIASSAGEYSVDGENFVQFSKGDWLIFNGSFWDLISNSGSVARVFSRKGHIVAGIKNGDPVYDYSWKQVIVDPVNINPDLNVNKSSIFEIEDVQTPSSLSAVLDQGVLKWDKNTKTWQVKKDEQGITSKIESSHIVDGEILNEDVSPNAKIKISKISNLQSKVDSKLNRVNGNFFGNLKISGSLLFIDRNNIDDAIINGVSLEKLHQDLQSLKLILNGKENAFSPTGSTTNYLNELKQFVRLNIDQVNEVGENKFLTNQRVIDTKLSDYENSIVGNNSAHVLSGETLVSAIKRFQSEINEFSTNQNFDASEIPVKSIELKHLANDSLGTEDVDKSSGNYTDGFLSFSNGFWRTKKISGGLVFKGAWDASTQVAPLSAKNGDLYIANKDGNFNGTVYRSGDWLVCINPPSADPAAPAEEWLKINNTGDVIGFKGANDVIPRDGAIVSKINDYTWEMIDKQNAKIEDLTDVDLTLGSGDTLKYVELDRDNNGEIDFRGWTLGTDDSGTSDGAISANRIQDNSITNTSILSPTLNPVNLGAQVLPSKFIGLEDVLKSKIKITGGDISGDFNLLQNEINIPGDLLDSVSISNIKNKIELINSLNDSRENTFPLNNSSNAKFYNENKELIELTTDAFNEININKYFTNDRVINAKLNGEDLPGHFNSKDIEVGSDNIFSAIQKLEFQLNSGSVPDQSINGDRFVSQSIGLDKLAKSTDMYNPFLTSINSKSASDGDTLKLIENQNGELFWGWSSISGINHQGDWDIASNNEFPLGDENGMYYILSSSGTDKNGLSWNAGDWAIYSTEAESWQQIPNAASFQSFNGRTGDILPLSGDYKFDQLDFSGATIDIFSDVDVSTNPPSVGDILKYNGLKWVPAPDAAGLSGTIYSENIIDGTISSNNFENGSFFVNDFDGLQAEIDSFYNAVSGNKLNSNLNFTGQSIKNCKTINGIDFINLYYNCSTAYSNLSNYQQTLPLPNLGPKDSNDQFFLNESLTFSKLDISQIASGVANAIYDPEEIRALPIPSIPSFPAGESPEINDEDTILSAVAKLWKKASQSFTLIEGDLIFGADITVTSNDNLNTYIIKSGVVNLPNISTVKRGFTVTVKSKSSGQVKIMANAQFDSLNKNEIILKNKWTSVRLVAGASKWFLIHKSGVVE